MDNEKQEKTALEKIADAMVGFWRKYSPAAIVRKTPNTQFFIEPRAFVGGKVNPEIAKLIVKEYLNSLSMDQVLKGEVFIAPQGVLIKDENGKPLLDIKNRRIINSMKNQVIQELGQALSHMKTKEGQELVEEKPSYCFADIANALAFFMHQQNKMDSKDLFKDACVLLLGSEGQRMTLTRPQ